jgi:hypothetical protein
MGTLQLDFELVPTMKILCTVVAGFHMTFPKPFFRFFEPDRQ